MFAQQQRIQSSQIQAFWLGFGQGDGLEAFELADVKGRINGLEQVAIQNNCDLTAFEMIRAQDAKLVAEREEQRQKDAESFRRPGS